MTKPRTKWSDELVERELMKAAGEDGVMPSSKDLRDNGRNDLAVQVSRRGGFLHWADRLGLSVKASASNMGYRWERHVEGVLKSHGYHVEPQTRRARFDLMVNGIVRVNVKSAHWNQYGPCSAFFFGIGETWASCDVFAMVRVSDDGPLPVLWVPWMELQQVSTLSLTRSHRFNSYENMKALHAALSAAQQIAG